MTRLERKRWLDSDDNPFGFKLSGGMMDAFDNVIKELGRMTDDEYDYYCEIATDFELNLITSNKLSFNEKKLLIKFLTEKVYGNKPSVS